MSKKSLVYQIATIRLNLDTFFIVNFIAGYKASMDTIYKGLGEYADCVDEADLADALATGSQVSLFCRTCQ